MKNYEYIVIGNGSGGMVAGNLLSHGKEIALINKPPPGGTCMNYGCIPSKTLIYPADRIAEINNSEKLGINATINNIDFKSIMQRMKKNRETSRNNIEIGIQNAPDLDFYEGEAQFIDDYTLKVDGTKIKGEKIIIATGAKPGIPPIEGLDSVDYLTNENLLELEEKPDSLTIIGGGYIAAEYGHFFSAMGTDVTILERNSRIVKNEEPEISELLLKKLSSRMDIKTEVEARKVENINGRITVTAFDKKNEKDMEINSEKLLIATGRKSTADSLKVEKSGIEVGEKGFIKVNEYLETSRENIWAMGDVIGKYMFKHVANHEASLLTHNLLHDNNQRMDYSAVPHAIFTYPEIAGVGMKEKEAAEEHDILVGKAHYSDVAMGKAMQEKDGFAKAIVDKDDLQVLGFHLIGPNASILIQEVVNLKTIRGDLRYISSMHIHPALPEIIIETLNNLKEVE